MRAPLSSVGLHERSEYCVSHLKPWRNHFRDFFQLRMEWFPSNFELIRYFNFGNDTSSKSWNIPITRSGRICELKYCCCYSSYFAFCFTPCYSNETCTYVTYSLRPFQHLPWSRRPSGFYGRMCFRNTIKIVQLFYSLLIMLSVLS